jgi:hypothetical protein
VNLEAIEKLADAVGLVTFVICLCGLIYYSELAKPDRPVSEAKP